MPSVRPETVRSFFSRRQMSAERDLKLFNGFTSALLDPRRALELRCDTPQGHLDGGAFVRFREPQRAVTPGQWCVLYRGDECLGGGPIDTTEPLKRIHI